MISEVKTHLNRHRTIYISAAVLGVGVCVGMRMSKPTQIINTVAPVFNNDNSSAAFGGYARKIVKCLETGQLWESVNDAAAAAGVSQSMMSKHLNGNKDHISNLHYQIIGLSSGV